MGMIRGKSPKAVVGDVSEGYTSMNPIMLKAIMPEDIKQLLEAIKKLQNEIRAEKFPHLDTHAIRNRNLRLQRLHTAAMIITNFVRERKISLI